MRYHASMMRKAFGLALVLGAALAFAPNAVASQNTAPARARGMSASPLFSTASSTSTHKKSTAKKKSGKKPTTTSKSTAHHHSSSKSSQHHPSTKPH